MMRRFVDRQLVPPAAPANREEWLRDREHLRHEILTAVGIDDLVPPRWPLGLQFKGTIQRQGYRIERLTFESYPGMAVTALLYLPEGTSGRVPGIVSIAGHVYGLGKAADFLQQRNVNLVRRGCVVLAYDYIDTGERNTGEDARHGKPYGGGNDHSIFSFCFSRRNPTGLEVLDAIRAIDVLESRPEVDRTRLGFTGESGGGNSTYWVGAVDPRVKLAVPVSSVTSFDYWIDRDRNWDWHQRPFGVRRHADIGTLLALHAPQPLLVISSRRGTDDHEFPLDQANKSVAWAGHVYRLLGAGGAIAHVESTTAHGYQQDKRERLYEAVERWLSPPRPLGPKEMPVRIESYEELRCGLPEKNLTLADIYAQWLKPLPRTGTSVSAGELAELRQFLRSRMGFPDPLPGVRATKAHDDQGEGWRARVWIIESEPGIRLPAIFIRGPHEGKTNTVVLVPGRDEAIAARALDAGHAVCVFDPRGTGEIAEGGGRTHNWAWFFGRPAVGQQAMDIVQVTRLIRAEIPNARVVVEPPARFAWVTLLAAAAEPGILISGRLSLPVSSLHEVVRSGRDAVLSEVPGLLERLDLPQLRLLSVGEISNEMRH
jgi:hypothetical protein